MGPPPRGLTLWVCPYLRTSGIIAEMPRRTIVPSQPDRVRSAVAVMSSQIRTEILRHLAAHQGSAPELAAEFGISRFSMIQHLEAMEAAGLVQASRPSGQRKGRRVVWVTDVATVAQLAEAWVGYATARHSPTAPLDVRDCPSAADLNR